MATIQGVMRAALAVVCGVALAACTSTLEPRTEGDPDHPEQRASRFEDDPNASLWRVERVIDGDTIVATQDGVEERVRLIGMDTPERGECGFDEAKDFLANLILGEDVILDDGATTDRDVHDRLLRYVYFDNQDMGLLLIAEGLAIARYDSRTNQPHPREARYREIDEATPHLCDSA